jgi:hypothetical protein
VKPNYIALAFRNWLQRTTAADRIPVDSPLPALAICLLMANLLYMSAAHALQDSNSPAARYFTFPQPPYTFEVSLLLNVLGVGTLLFLLERYIQRFRSVPLAWAYRCWFLALFSAGIFRFLRLPEVVTGVGLTYESRAYYVALAAVALGCALITLLALPIAYLRTRTILLVLFPLLPIEIGTHVWHRFTQPELLSKSGKPFPPAPAGTPRVIWMIFDEMDQRIAFERTVPGLSLPQLDRLRKESFYATSALPPAKFTRESMISLVTGRTVKSVFPTASGGVMLESAENGSSSLLAQEPTIFARLRSLGLHSGLVGWFHPYCRLFGEDLDSCTSSSSAYNAPSRWRNYINGLPLREALWKQFIKATRVFYSQEVEFAVSRSKTVRRFGQQRSKAISLVKDTSLNLVFLHFSIPHPPGIYDLATNTVSSEKPPSYVGNFVLVDRIVGEVRQTLESAGLWDQSIVLLSSDHSLRLDIWVGEDPHAAEVSRLRSKTGRSVPFLLKMPFEKRGLEYAQPFNTVISADLLLEIINGRVASSEGIARWLDSHSRTPAITSQASSADLEP